MTLAIYLPQDRRRALAQGKTLPDRAHGSVLFADISGFTPFTEALRHAYGSRRGAEELTKQLDRVYTPLIAEVERYGGSVTGFAGDGITCWFDGADQAAPPRAVACAVALQAAMHSLGEIALPNGVVVQLTVKIGVATGEVRRLVVGDGAHYWLDVLAGETVNHTAVAEQLAFAPEILLDEKTITALGDTITLTAWRTSEETGQRFGVLDNFTAVVNPTLPASLPGLEEETTRPWLDPLVYEREKTGHALLQTDFRPCIALFVRFAGIDYEADTAADQLNQFIRPLQAILAHYEGTLIDLTFGDKGSYVYLNFGALSIHEDDARRAAKTALRLRELAQTLPFLEPLQMGITSGVMRTGAYGGSTRRHYGALGDEVNVAARLMTTAVGDQILLSEAVYQAIHNEFNFTPHPSLSLKGKKEPIHAYQLTTSQAMRPLPLHEPAYTLPMVGREAELATMAAKLDLAAGGASQIVSLVGEAGLGKSRLAAEALRMAHGRGFASHNGACQADGLNTPYLVWKQIWSSFFGLDPQQAPALQCQHLRQQVHRFAPERVEALPLLGRLFDLPLPENSFTQGLEPKNRQTALHALLEDCLKQACTHSPLFMLIEDLHWIDALSHDLLVDLAQSCAKFPIFFLLVYRPTDLSRLQAPRLEARPNFTPLPLAPLNETDARQLIQAKLSQLYPDHALQVAPALSQSLLRRVEGNPFYLEELLNYLHGRGLDPRQETSWETDLPDSLHALILSRLDQLQPSQKRTMRVASVIGRLFPVSWLIGYYPALGELPQVQADLAILHDLDLTLLESNEPELAYLFKHIITHEVTYESLPYATRARLHEQLATYLERVYTETVPLAMLAFHYGRSDNIAKQKEYLRRAGEAAQKNFANDAALNFYSMLLPLLTNDHEKLAIYLQRGQVLEMLGQWQEAESDYRTALELAHDNDVKQARAQWALGKLNGLCGEYEVALNWLVQAREIQLALNDNRELSKTLIEMGVVLWRQGNYVEARQRLNEGLALAQEMGDRMSVSLALLSLGNIVHFQGDYSAAQALYEQSLSLQREMDDRGGISISLANMAVVVHDLGDYVAARALYEESLSLRRAMGNKRGVSISLVNIGVAAYDQGDFVAARALYEESLTLCREMGDKEGIAYVLNNLGLLAMRKGDYAEARVLYEESLSLKREMGDKKGISASLSNLGIVAQEQGEFALAQSLHEESLSLKREMGNKQGIAVSLNNLGIVAQEQGKLPLARSLYEESLSLKREIGDKKGILKPLNSMGYLNLMEGDIKGAQALFVEHLILSREMGLKDKIIESFIGLAVVAGAIENHGRVVHLAAAAEALYVGMEIGQASLQRSVYTKVVATTRAALGEEAFASNWAEAVAWSLEEAVSYALEEESF